MSAVESLEALAFLRSEIGEKKVEETEKKAHGTSETVAEFYSIWHLVPQERRLPDETS